MFAARHPRLPYLLLCACASAPPASTASTSASATAVSSSTSSSDASSSSTSSSSEDTTSDAATSDSSSTAASPAICGNGLVENGELCDNGANQTYWYSNRPLNACSEACDHSFETCGDGEINGPEACDDANRMNGDGCAKDCLNSERQVFVTSTLYMGDFDFAHNNPNHLTGLDLADFRCQSHAEAALLPGTYKAWLSDSTHSPSTRFDTSFTGLYRLRSKNFPVIAHGWSDLTDSELLAPIDADEQGFFPLNVSMWTNTLPDGKPASNFPCMDWGTIMLESTASVGSSAASDAAWTHHMDSQVCGGSRSLYCFEDPT